MPAVPRRNGLVSYLKPLRLKVNLFFAAQPRGPANAIAGLCCQLINCSVAINEAASPVAPVPGYTGGCWETPAPALAARRAPGHGGFRAVRPPPATGGHREAGSAPCRRPPGVFAGRRLYRFPLPPGAAASAPARASG